MRDLVYGIITFVLMILSLTSYVPQLLKIIKTRSAKDLSLVSWLLYDLYFVLYIILLLMDRVGIGVIAVTILENLLSLAVTISIIKYGKVRSDTFNE